MGDGVAECYWFDGPSAKERAAGWVPEPRFQPRVQESWELLVDSRIYVKTCVFLGRRFITSLRFSKGFTPPE